jgi:uncharacterized protein YbjT (DUF2867 family)
MFLDKFDADGVLRGPAKETRGAFIPREDDARIAAAVLAEPLRRHARCYRPDGLSLAEVARWFSVMIGRQLRYLPESVSCARDRLNKREPDASCIDPFHRQAADES